MIKTTFRLHPESEVKRMELPTTRNQAVNVATTVRVGESKAFPEVTLIITQDTMGVAQDFAEKILEAVAELNNDAKRGLDELTRISQELGLYDSDIPEGDK